LPICVSSSGTLGNETTVMADLPASVHAFDAAAAAVTSLGLPVTTPIVFPHRSE
jgi:hypothetical protein